MSIYVYVFFGIMNHVNAYSHIGSLCIRYVAKNNDLINIHLLTVHLFITLLLIHNY